MFDKNFESGKDFHFQFELRSSSAIITAGLDLEPVVVDIIIINLYSDPAVIEIIHMNR
jgi:hypothetical protein